jgi:conjugative transfer signal peptidase TraF
MRALQRRERALLVAAAVVAVLAGIGPVAAPGRLVLYNRTPSVPVGWYYRLFKTPERGDYVALPLPPAAWSYAQARGETPSRVRFMKVIAAMAGDRVCAERDRLIVNGRALGEIRAADAEGRLLPRWSQCRTLDSSEVFLVSAVPDSFDSRYFGPVSLSDLEGVYVRWTWSP